MLEVSKPRKPVKVTEVVDDGNEVLSKGRFLRPPESATKFWSMVPLAWEAGEPQKWSAYTGTRDSMPAGTFASRAERDVYLTSKYWSKKVRQY